MSFQDSVPDDESSFSGDNEKLLPGSTREKRPAARSLLVRLSPWIAHGTLLLFSISFLYSGWHERVRGRQTCLQQNNAWSPMLPAIDHDRQEVFWNGSLFHETPYKGPPSEKVEEAWHEIMQYGLIGVSGDDLQRAGYELNSVQFPEAAGGGYLATTTGTHHLHCLHYIWQDHYIDMIPEAKARKANAGAMYDTHYEHCIDYLRLGIMCNYDMTMIAYNWVLDHQVPTPNGNTNHMCVNWDKTQAWLKERSVDVPEGFSWHQPPDAVSLDYNP